MTTGADMKRPRADVDNTFRALRPAALDELAEDAYSRRRDADLDRITQTDAPGGASLRRRLRRPTLLLVSVATAGATVAGVTLVSAIRDDTPPSVTTSQSPGPSPSLDARRVLLASAQTAERTKETPGRYWYTKERTRSLHDTEFPRGRLGSGKPGRGVTKLPYAYVRGETQESWLSRTGRDRTRTITSIDVKTEFPTPRDEAEWRRAGAPRLIEPFEAKPSTNNYDMAIRYTIGNEQVPTDVLLKLSTDADALAAELQRRHARDVRKAENPDDVGSFPSYVWATAQDLLAGPITPGTKAALYRVLARQPGIRSEGKATDLLGREGVALSMTAGVNPRRPASDGPADMETRLIIDPRTGRLLAYESYAGGKRGTPLLSETYLAMGWVGGLGARP